jgi:hypothetical protein
MDVCVVGMDQGVWLLLCDQVVTLHGRNMHLFESGLVNQPKFIKEERGSGLNSIFTTSRVVNDFGWWPSR